MNQFLPEWDTFSASLKKETTRKEYLATLKEFLQITGLEHWDITPEDVEKYYCFYKSKINKKQIKGSTVFKKFRICSSYHSSLGIEGVNPFMTYIKYLKEYDQKMKCRTIPIDQIDYLLQTAQQESLMLYVILSLIYRASLRPVDICEIKMGHFLNNGPETYLKIKKGRRENIVYIPEDVVALINLYIKENAIDISQKDKILFYNSRGNPLQVHALQMYMEKLTAKAKTPPYTLYDLRNSSAALLFAYGAAPSDVARQLNIGLQDINRYQNSALETDLIHYANKLVKIKIAVPAEEYPDKDVD